MSNVKSVYDNFESLPDKDKKDGDSCLDRIINKFVLEATFLTYIRNSEKFFGSLFE